MYNRSGISQDINIYLPMLNGVRNVGGSFKGLSKSLSDKTVPFTVLDQLVTVNVTYLLKHDSKLSSVGIQLY